MILVLHGENTKNRDERFREIKSSQKSRPFVYGKENTYDDLYQAVNGTTLLEEKVFIIIENFIKDKKLKPKDNILSVIPENKFLLLVENAQLPPKTVTELSKVAKIENFKPDPQIFWFLDSLCPDYRRVSAKLAQLPESEGNSLVWNLTNRCMLMLLSKLNYTNAQVSEITGRSIAPWQWQKIKNQAKYFSTQSLNKIFQGMLKIDFMQKNGQTNLPPKTLISYLLLKYLNV